MERSIEKIWKEGFLKDDALVTPKINDLYRQKSGSTFDKIMKRINVYLVFLIVFPVAFLGYVLLSDVSLLIGIFIFLLYSVLAVYGIKQKNQLKNVDKHVSSYEYLKSVDRVIKDQISRNVRLSRFVYPTAVLSAGLIMMFSNGNHHLIEVLLVKYPDLILIGGVPLYFILAIVLLATLMTVFAGKIYRGEVCMMYGPEFRKLEEIISDLEELRD